MYCKFHCLNVVKDRDSRALLISILGFDDATMMQEVEQLISATHNIGKVSQ